MKEVLAFIRKNPAIIYSIALIIVLPAFLLFYTYLVTSAFDSAFESEAHRKALAIGGIVGALNADSNFGDASFGKRLGAITQNQTDVTNISILLPASQNGDFRVVVASDEQDTGKVLNSFGYTIAWQEKRALATRVRVFENNRSLSQWLVIQPLRDDQGRVFALASILLDQAAARAAQEHVFNVSALALVLFVLLVVLLIGNNARLFEKARLFQELRELDKMKDEFISIASHELRTPISGVRGHLSLALEGSYGKVNAGLKKGLQSAYDATNHLSKMIEDILEVSRIEQGRIELEPKIINPSAIAKAAVTELQVQAKAKNLGLDFKERLPLPRIKVDPDRLKQVLINLLGNSIKYTNSGAVHLSLGANGKGELTFTIEDTGIGISAEDQKKLFEKFHRVKSAETAKVRGTGLGLWITKRLVEVMGGNIGVESIAGKGSKFLVSFSAAPK